jgi:NAD-dependent deacetylase
MNPSALQYAAAEVRRAEHVVVFTGAGVSAESGIPTFRDAAGLWQRFPPEQFARWDSLLRTALGHPEELAEFLIAFLQPIVQARPNPAHHAIARLAQHVRTTVITQNVDGLHQEAGSTVVHEIHGNLFEIETLDHRIVRCLTKEELGQLVNRLQGLRSGYAKAIRLGLALRPILGLPPGTTRPRLVLFGDMLAEPDWSRAQQASREADVLIVVGTSGMVWPAAGLPLEAKERGTFVIDVDPHEAGAGQIWLRDRAGEVLPRLVEAAFTDHKPSTNDV